MQQAANMQQAQPRAFSAAVRPIALQICCLGSRCLPGARHRQQTRLGRSPFYGQLTALTVTTPRCSRRHAIAAACTKELNALIFDCDGVIIESEETHRVAYNASFANFDVRPKGEEVADWSVEYYDMLQNKVGGGKNKQKYFFSHAGWPTSKLLPEIPASDEEKNALVDVLQDWKSTKYQDLIASGEVPARPGVLELMDAARAAGLKLGVCSAATKSSAIVVLESLLGKERYEALDVCLLGDDVPKLKPDPTIYRIAAERLGLDPAECLVVEDSTIGLQAALGAGMRCIITCTSSTADQDFEGAERVLPSLDAADPPITIESLKFASAPQDSRQKVAP